MSNINQLAPPPKVTTAIKLLYISIGIDIIRYIIDSSRNTDTIAGILSILAWTTLIGKIYNGENWARIGLIVFLFTSAIFSIDPMIHNLKHNSIFGYVYLATIVARIAALFFLFQRESSVWFVAVKQSIRENFKQKFPKENLVWLVVFSILFFGFFGTGYYGAGTIISFIAFPFLIFNLIVLVCKVYLWHRHKTKSSADTHTFIGED